MSDRPAHSVLVRLPPVAQQEQRQTVRVKLGIDRSSGPLRKLIASVLVLPDAESRNTVMTYGRKLLEEEADLDVEVPEDGLIEASFVLRGGMETDSRSHGALGSDQSAAAAASPTGELQTHTHTHARMS